MLLSEADVTEVLLALADGDDTSALFKHLHDELLCGVLWQTPTNTVLQPGGLSLMAGGGRSLKTSTKEY